MFRSFTSAAGLLLCVALGFSVPAAGQAQATPSVRRVQVLGARNPVEIEIEASDRLTPRTQLLTGPDRLVVDFPNAVPGAQLRNQKLSHGDVKSVRVGLFSTKPPVTRLVFDLNGPQHYQVFPYGRTVIVKVGGAEAATTSAKAPSKAGLVNASFPAQSTQLPAQPPLVVSFQGGMLTISSDKASLSEVLFAVHQRTGAEIAIPAGAEQEKVVAELGPASAPDVLSHLLNGSKFNFLILSSPTDPGTLDRVILSARPEGPMPPPSRPQAQAREEEVEPEPPPARGNPTTEAAPPVPVPNPAAERQLPAATPDTKAPPPTPTDPD